MSERRRSLRYPFHSRGTLWIEALDCPGLLLNISLCGLLFIIDAAHEIKSGDACKLTVYFAGKMAFLTIDGRVAHLHDHLIGIEFVHESKTLEQSLRRMVDLNPGTSRLLDRDIPALLRSY